MSSVSTFLAKIGATPGHCLGRYVRATESDAKGWIIAYLYDDSYGRVLFHVAKEKRTGEARTDWVLSEDRLEFAEEPKVAPTEVEEAVCGAIRARRDAGRKKYGTTMERQDLTPLQWLQHAQEEAMDFAIYLEKLRRVLGEQEQELQRLRKENADLRLARTDPILHKAISEGGGPG